MISINDTLFLQVIHFLILVFILNRIMLRPILKVIDERTEKKENSKVEIKELEVKTNELREEFLDRETKARKNASEDRANVRAEGLTRAEEFLDESRKDVTAIRVKASEDVTREVNSAQLLLNDQAASLVDEIMEKLIGRRTMA